MTGARLALAILIVAALPSLARGFTPDPVDMAKAKQEGSVSWYTSVPTETAQKIANLFTEQTGIKVQLFRSGGSSLLRRFMQEADANRIAADLLSVSDPGAMSALVKRGLLVPFRPPHFEKIPAEAKDPDGHYVAQRLNALGIIVRSDLVPAKDVPKSWTDLTDPRYRGKLVMPDPSFAANQLQVVAMLSRKYGWEFYRKLKANDTMIVQGHQQVSDALKRGERAIAAEGSDGYAWQDRADGHRVVTVFPADGAFLVPSPSAVIKGGPHPNAAKALAAFLLSDTVQTLLPDEGIYAARADIRPPAGSPKLADLKLIPIDFEYVEAESAATKNRFNEIFQ